MSVKALVQHPKATSQMWSVEDCLVELLADVRGGKLKPKQMLVLLMSDDVQEPGNDRLTRRRVDLTSREEISLLEIEKTFVIRDWLGSD